MPGGVGGRGGASHGGARRPACRVPLSAYEYTVTWNGTFGFALAGALEDELGRRRVAGGQVPEDVVALTDPELAAGDLRPHVVSLHVPEARALGLEAADPADPEPEALVREGVGERERGAGPDRSGIASRTAPSAVGPLIATRLPLPPVPWPKQSAPGSVWIRVVARVLAMLGERRARGVDDAKVGALVDSSQGDARATRVRTTSAAAATPPSRNPGMTI